MTGGVPRYLEEVDPAATAEENIRRLCFRPKGVLREDFDEMFLDVVTRQPTFTARVLRRLAEGSASAAEIADGFGMERGGRVSDALEQLAESGLVSEDASNNPLTGRPAREKRYRLRDNYARFYLRYIEPSKTVIDADAFAFAGFGGLEGWDATMGLAFENLVVNNYRELLGPIGLGTAQVLSAAPYRRAGSGKAPGSGVQVDLLLQTRRSICLVEVKREREIGREVIAEMQEKVKRVPRQEGMSVKTALVYEGHLAHIVETDGYFDAIVPFRRMLGI